MSKLVRKPTDPPFNNPPFTLVSYEFEEGLFDHDISFEIYVNVSGDDPRDDLFVIVNFENFKEFLEHFHPETHAYFVKIRNSIPGYFGALEDLVAQKATEEGFDWERYLTDYIRECVDINWYVEHLKNREIQYEIDPVVAENQRQQWQNALEKLQEFTIKRKARPGWTDLANGILDSVQSKILEMCPDLFEVNPELYKTFGDEVYNEIIQLTDKIDTIIYNSYPNDDDDDDSDEPAEDEDDEMDED